MSPVLREQCAALPELDALTSIYACRAPDLDYRHIHEDSTLSLGIFGLSKGKQLPLHNHPRMTVLSRHACTWAVHVLMSCVCCLLTAPPCRVLFGELAIESYDFAEPGADPLAAYQQPLPAVPVADVTLKASIPLL